jgi:hypothetical protein
MKKNQNLLSPKENQPLCYFKNRFTDKNQLLKIPFWFLILFCSTVIKVNAQTPIDATLSFDSGQGTFYVALPDSNITDIELNIGSKANLTDVFSYTYTFDQTSGLPSGLSFSRNGLNTFLGLGTVAEQNVYNSKVRLKNTSGGWGSWYEIISN